MKVVFSSHPLFSSLLKPHPTPTRFLETAALSVTHLLISFRATAESLGADGAQAKVSGF